MIVISGFTYIIDGKIARKFNKISDVGKVLDPIADKLTQAALVICLIARYHGCGHFCLIRDKRMSDASVGIFDAKSTDTINGANGTENSVQSCSTLS